MPELTGSDGEGSADEWNMDRIGDCVEILEEKFPAAEITAAGLTISQFTKIATFYVTQLAKKIPKAPLSVRFKKGLDSGMFNNKKTRANWLKNFHQARLAQFLPKNK